MSALFDNEPHVITVFPEVRTVDGHGNPVKRPAATGVTITGCLVTPISPGHDRDTEHVDMDYRLVARDSPLGPWSRITWNQRNFVIVAGPNQFAMSELTTHVEATLRDER